MRVRARSLLACSLAAALLGAAPATRAAEPSPARPAEPPARAAEPQEEGFLAMPPEVEAAIDRGLAYLAAEQNADGGWATKYRTAVTGLALMAFMLKGHFPDRAPHGEVVGKGVDYLLAEGRQRHGLMSGGDRSMYEQGLATLALSEAWGMSGRRNPEIRQGLKLAVDVIIRAQTKRDGSKNDGGWRYDPQPGDADLSHSVMLLMALASAQEAGILVPDDTMTRAVAYVKRCFQEVDGGFSYLAGRGESGYARTAGGCLSLMIAGQRQSPEAQMALKYLLRAPDTNFANTSHYCYAHYYAIQTMYQAGEQPFRDWYPKISTPLLKMQSRDGSFRVPSDYTGGEYSTAFAILILGVPYRFLPIYQR